MMEGGLVANGLDLRYPSSSQNDKERANAVFAGAVLIYRALPAVQNLWIVSVKSRGKNLA